MDPVNGTKDPYSKAERERLLNTPRWKVGLVMAAISIAAYQVRSLVSIEEDAPGWYGDAAAIYFWHGLFLIWGLYLMAHDGLRKLREWRERRRAAAREREAEGWYR